MLPVELSKDISTLQTFDRSSKVTEGSRRSLSSFYFSFYVITLTSIYRDHEGVDWRVGFHNLFLTMDDSFPDRTSLNLCFLYLLGSKDVVLTSLNLCYLLLIICILFY
ncbi:hypothetical protein AMTRI_Chr11g156150 [Amborella trichopoda]